MWSYIITHAAPLLSVHPRFQILQSKPGEGVSKQEDRLPHIGMCCGICKWTASGEPYSQSEVSAATTKMVNANQILVAEGMIFLI